MKRSDINAILREADAFIQSFGFRLPPFAYWTPEQMQARSNDIGAIVEHRLGWDITDFGQAHFDSTGLFLFTVRNGSRADLARGGGMCYAEKIMVSRRDQVCPMHRHNLKVEDIINRGGATLAIELFQADDDGGIDTGRDVQVISDGVAMQLAAGSVLRLEPGQSVTLFPNNWHAFWGDGGDVLIGEVSTVNDDLTDNVFRDEIGRFAAIEEDEPPLHLLVADYDHWLKR